MAVSKARSLRLELPLQPHLDRHAAAQHDQARQGVAVALEALQPKPLGAQRHHDHHRGHRHQRRQAEEQRQQQEAKKRRDVESEASYNMSHIRDFITQLERDREMEYDGPPDREEHIEELREEIEPSLISAIAEARDVH